MPRNEFLNHPREEGEEGTTPESPPVEVTPELRHKSLAYLREQAGFTTTLAHIAEINAKSAAKD